MTQQPPPGGGQENYAQPQDPWAGHFEPGLASVPTDPIPQPGAGYQPGDVWSQPTMPQQPGPYAYVPQEPPRSRAGVIVLILVVILVLGGGGGFAAYKVLTAPQANATTPPVTQTTTGSGSTPAIPSTFPYSAKVGDCVYNAGTAGKPSLEPSACDRAGSYKIVRKRNGPGIPTAANGSFDRDTTAATVCAGVTYQTWYGYQTGTPALDLFFCMTNN